MLSGVSISPDSAIPRKQLINHGSSRPSVGSRPLRSILSPTNGDIAHADRPKGKAARRRLLKFNPDDQIRQPSMLALTSDDRPSIQGQRSREAASPMLRVQGPKSLVRR